MECGVPVVRRRKWWDKALLTLVCLLGQSPGLAAGQDFFPIENVRPGLRGIGRTVFQGDRIEDFQVEILGVLQNFGPRQPIILARLSGGPLAQTGILQGMSGSPVYIDGKLLGAVALGFPFSKEPIAGIQPIQSMIDGATFGGRDQDGPTAVPADFRRFSGGFNSLLQLFSSTSPSRKSPYGDISDISTPLTFSGFSSETVTTLDASVHPFGLTALTGVAGNAQNSPLNSDNPPKINHLKVFDLKPGAMISVGLVTGDWNMTADGTVTYIDGNRVYAFGHRLLNIGNAELPFALSDVVACIPSVNTSFKLSAPREWVGSIVSDRATAIAGEFGRTAHTIPLNIVVDSGTTGSHTYHLNVVNDRLLTPFLTQAALFSILDSTERTIGTETLRLQGEVHFTGNLPPLVVHDIFVSDSGLSQQASADAVVTLAFVLGGGFSDLQIKDMTYRLDTQDRKKIVRLSQAWTSAHDVRPGDTIDITAVLQGENGTEVVKTIPYQIPAGAPSGLLNLTLSDANTLNFPEFAGIAQTQFRTSAALINGVNRYRDSGALFVRVWRQQPAFNVAGPMPGGELSDPPPSVVLILTDTSASASGGAAPTTRGSDVAQLSVAVPGYVVTGAKTVQVEIKD